MNLRQNFLPSLTEIMTFFCSFPCTDITVSYKHTPINAHLHFSHHFTCTLLPHYVLALKGPYSGSTAISTKCLPDIKFGLLNSVYFVTCQQTEFYIRCTFCCSGCENVPVVLPEGGISRAEICRSNAVLITCCG